MLIIDGRAEPTPGIRCTSFGEKPELALTPEDYRPRRTHWIRSIVLHTTKGIPGGADHRPQVIRPGFGAPVGAGDRDARCWAQDGRHGGAHLTVDFDGSVSQHCDLVTVAAYHAGMVNDVSIGIEIYQGAEAELYEGQFLAVVRLVDLLTARFGIQRQVPEAYAGAPLARLERGALDFVGIFGHRDCSGTRGAGDPGDAIFARLVTAGYERFDVARGDDLQAWRRRQASLGVAVDGVPGPATVRAMAESGYAAGLWVRRPEAVA